MSNLRNPNSRDIEAALASGSSTVPGLEGLSAWAAELRGEVILEIPRPVVDQHIFAMATSVAAGAGTTS